MSEHVHFWAKLSEDGSSYHPLIAHSADVAAVFEAISAPGAVFFDRLAAAAGIGVDTQVVRSALIYLAALHDLGKANHGFQDKAGPWARSERRWLGHGHVIPVIASMEAGGQFTAAVLEILKRLPFGRTDAVDAFRTAIAHHGRPWLRDPRSRPRTAWAKIWAADAVSGRVPLDEISRLRRHAERWSCLSPVAEPRDEVFPWTPALANIFAGLLTVADWIGSTERIFWLTPAADENPDAYWESAQERAARAVKQVGIRPSDVLVEDGLDVYPRLFPAVFPKHEPTVLQGLTAQMELPGPGSRLVIESETGSGKTESVLALYARLRAAGRVDGLVFALPTRATAKAMYDRIADSLPRLHPSGATPPLALAMGGARNEVGAPNNMGLDPDLYPDPEEQERHRWASESHKRYFAAEIVVGTVDQVLLAGLPVRHAHMRHALLARQLVVVDEIHSYDRYMNSILHRVLEHHGQLGGVAVFLSATLSREARDGLAGGIPDCDLATAIDAPYPSVSVLAPTTGDWNQVEARTAVPPKRVRWSLASQREMRDDFFREVIRVAQAGGRVCLLRNTVREARASVACLAELAPSLLWRPGDMGLAPAYHSRFIDGDRAFIDSAAIHDFGKGSQQKGVILVATQVIEQSLDVDFDFLVTDLAPVDVLLQRIGRLHRHRRVGRPASAAAPRVIVQAPQAPFAPCNELRNAGFGWGPVYGEVSDLELTRRLIASMPEIVIPRDNRLLVESVYHSEAREALASEGVAWRSAVDAGDGRGLALSVAGSMGALDLDVSYPSQASRYDAAQDERIRTRIGDDRILVTLDRLVRGWYDRTASAEVVPLRLGQLRRAGGIDLSAPVARFEADSDQGPIYSVGTNLRIRYAPEGWVECHE